jgi:hypothetical protein
MILSLIIMSTGKINLVIKCPHCNDSIIIEELNCKIFRHGIFKDNHNQINPHATKVECDNYVLNDLIYGCGKPFRIIDNNIVEICDYI